MKDNSSLRETLRQAKESELGSLTDEQFAREHHKGGSFRLSAWIQLVRNRLHTANYYTTLDTFSKNYNETQGTTILNLMEGKRNEFKNSLPPFLSNMVDNKSVFEAVPADLLLRIIEEDDEQNINFCPVFSLEHCSLPDGHLDKKGKSS